MSELVYRQPCSHGRIGSHWWDAPIPDDPKNQVPCAGGVEVVLDPDKMLFDDDYVHVRDVLAILDKEGE